MMFPKGTILNHQQIKKLIKEKRIISDYFNLDTQLTPNGFDLTIHSIYEFTKAGSLDFSNKDRIIPPTEQIFAKRGWWNLRSGAYKVRANEKFNLPDNLIAIAFPRSSLLRIGAFTHTAVWDAGFRGFSEFILVVENSFGIKLRPNARIVQLIFIKINKTRHKYQGVYLSK